MDYPLLRLRHTPLLTVWKQTLDYYDDDRPPSRRLDAR
jgi:hypothetical protein